MTDDTPKKDDDGIKLVYDSASEGKEGTPEAQKGPDEGMKGLNVVFGTVAAIAAMAAVAIFSGRKGPGPK